MFCIILHYIKHFQIATYTYNLIVFQTFIDQDLHLVQIIRQRNQAEIVHAVAAALVVDQLQVEMVQKHLQIYFLPGCTNFFCFIHIRKSKSVTIGGIT